MLTKSLRFLCVLLFTFSLQAASNVDTLFVSRDGNDEWAGTLEKPLATLAGARDKARKLDHSSGITIFVRAGTYELADTLTLAPEDSGTAGHPVMYTTFPNERVTLTGGRILKGWRKEGKFWVADVPQKNGRWYFAQLFVNGKMQRRSWTPNSDDWKTKWPLTTRGLPHNELHLPQEAVDLYYPGNIIKNWSNLRDVEVTILAQFRWANNIIPLKAVDEANKHAVLAAPASYNINANDPFRVENTIEGIDQPGEWALNTVEGKIYFLAPDDLDVEHAEIIAPKLTQLVRFNGNPEHMVYDITFRGFTFNGANRHQWDEADPSMRVGTFTAADTAVFMEGVSHCTIEDCLFVGLAGNGIELSKAALENRIVRNEIAGAGGSGIRLRGYEPGTTDLNKRNVVERNHIHNIATDFWASPGIFVWQSGENKIAHNYIHDVGYIGISLGGNWFENFRLWKNKPGHGFNWDELPLDDPFTRQSVKKFLHARNNRIEYNVIHDHIQSGFYDGGAIYTVSLGVSNQITGNLIYHAPQPRSFGLSFDHQSDYLIVKSNIIFGCETAASNSDSTKPYPENNPIYGSELNVWEGNQLYGAVFPGTPASSGTVPPAVLQIAELMTKEAAATAGPSWR